MKKLLNISVIAALAILPVAANAAAGDVAPQTYAIVAGESGTTLADKTNAQPVAAGDALYTGKTVTTEDESHVATASYVKGAYNAALSAVNKVSLETDEKLEEYTKTTDLQTTYATKDGVVNTVDAATASGAVELTVADITPAGSVSSSLSAATFSGSVTLPESVTTVTTWGDDNSTTPLPLNDSENATAISGNVSGTVTSTFTGTTITGVKANGNATLDVDVDEYHETANNNG